MSRLARSLGCWRWLASFGIGLWATAASAKDVSVAGQVSLCDSVTDNLVHNCGFETGDFSEWTQSGDQSFTEVTARARASGDWGAEFGPAQDLGFISQTISTVANQAYNLTFRLQTVGQPNHFQVFWNGELVFGRVDLPNLPFTEFNFNRLVATGTTTELKFAFFNPSDLFFLDDIVVTDAAEISARPYIDLECYAINGGVLERFLMLDQLNPLFGDLGWPREQAVLVRARELCVPVAKNLPSNPLPDTVRQLIQYIDLKCYEIAGQPMNLNLQLEHLNPVIRSLLPSEQLSEQVLVQRPQRLCVPVRKNDQEIPPDIQRIVQYIDLRCYEIQDFGDPLNLPLTLDQLNPELLELPSEDVVLQRPSKLCLPVRKNDQMIPPDVLELIQYFDQMCYPIGGSPPQGSPIRLSHINPELVRSPPEVVALEQPQDLCVPVIKRLVEGVR
jgi:hypothetical protein